MAGRDKLLTLAAKRTRRKKSVAVVSNIRALKGGSKPMLWVRTAAGPTIGFGHLRRSVTLCHLLSDTFLPAFLCDPWDPWSRGQAVSQDWRYIPFVREGLWTHKVLPSGLLIDTREVRGLLQLIMDARSHGVPVISIHDLGLNPVPSDLVIDGSVLPVAYDTPLRYTEFRYGTSYMVLDPSFATLHGKKKRINRHTSRVVINLGGGDSRAHYPKILQGLRSWNHELEVLGIPGFTDWGQQELEDLDWSPLRFRWIRRTEPVHEPLFRADMAITAGGLSAFESLCVGTPLLAVAFDELQQVTVTTLARANACIDLGLAARLEPEKLIAALSALDTDVALRQRLSERGRCLVDGRGAERVAGLIQLLVHQRLNQMAGMRSS
jgi:spore coat polysaccharide biosynthesis predicted glycosyltransferase SpsG